jgi:hypothetical protein
MRIDGCPLSPRGVGRVPRICRPTIWTDVRPEALALLPSLIPTMAHNAQALQFAEPKRIDVTMMGLDVVSHRCRHDQATFSTEGTERFSSELCPCDPLPTPCVVQGMIARLAGH